MRIKEHKAHAVLSLGSGTQLLFNKYLFVIIFIVSIVSHSSLYVALIRFPKHLVFSINFRSISERPDSFIRGDVVEVTDARRCTRNRREGAREEAVWDPGWMPVNRNFYLETSLWFGNEARSQGGKGWGCSGLSASLTTSDPFPAPVHGSVNNEQAPPSLDYLLHLRKNTNKVEGRKRHNGQHVRKRFFFFFPEFLAVSKLVWGYNYLDI